MNSQHFQMKLVGIFLHARKFSIDTDLNYIF